MDEALGLLQQGLLVDEVAADDAVLRRLPEPGEGLDAVDHPLGLFGLALCAWQRLQARQQLLLLAARILPALLEAPPAGTRLEVLDVVEDRGTSVVGRSFQRGRAMSISPTQRMPYLSR